MQTNISIVNRLQKLSSQLFAGLIKTIPSIEVCLEWDLSDVGVYRDACKDVQFGDYFIRFKLCVIEEGTTVPATYETPREYNMESRTIDADNVEVYYNKREYTLTQAQEDLLCEAIENKILLS